ncbi:MAG: hypothetical protein A3G32_09005 [Deltaproteobacteria bacterium RIFCSPLOWO2_12_FULL_40_28]|nr:MAG: hypothetical protein A3C45_05855 [Deltaproteobacteria bacterium RIFCSPHIGHO2_02_FULL_40_28]OGQ19836.1 MAG: hypothetical protein A3E27_01055 [Deltaproteobacteria bacterium RIFCSPHIGHO2_12_FULL_40_32]OGQ39927.1 MAG: hypothetical protein A3I69_09535 [Deltaproteobacteria bacterium RIFCSPLOWO2_02_FULL_40_36]OGQ54229.1 MAG: hypothetical protein A3G32_09005 [Deltaproteobacteria bacterium RIFCSPLOWO2_12_FULL_40_28]
MRYRKTLGNCRNKVFSVDKTITLDTADLHGKEFDWRHYGGPLALFRLCRFVRTQILNDPVKPRENIPVPVQRIYQQGNLILKETKTLEDWKHGYSVKIEPQADGGISLGDGHVLYPIGEKYMESMRQSWKKIFLRRLLNWLLVLNVRYKFLEDEYSAQAINLLFPH